MATSVTIPSVTLVLLADPAVDGTLIVSDSSRFEIGSVVSLAATGQPTKVGQVVGLPTPNSLKVARLGDGGNLDMSAYTVALGASISQAQQAVSSVGSTDPELVSTVAAGVTVNSNAAPIRVTWKATISYTAFTAAALTHDVSLCTVPAKGRVVSVISDTTAAFAGLAGTIAIKIGTTAAGGEYIASHDVKSAVVTKGLADADMGSALLLAAAVQNGDLPSWSAGTVLKLRMTSGTGNIGDGTATLMSAGSVTVYVTVELAP